jgi:hypothetical protein
MRQGISNQIDYMLIYEFVKEVSPHPAPANQPFRAEKPQPLRHSGEFVPKRADHFGNATFARKKQFHQPQPRSVAEGAKYPTRPVQCDKG